MCLRVACCCSLDGEKIRERGAFSCRFVFVLYCFLRVLHFVCTGCTVFVLKMMDLIERKVHDPMSTCRFPDVLQRAADSETGNRDSVMCDVCGETFPGARSLRKHLRYNCTGAF